MPVWPAFVIADDPANLLFHVEVDDPPAALRVMEGTLSEPADEGRRSYVTVLAKRRLHQEAFRQRVIRAYRGICAICRLRHVELLDAAHILPDGHPRGAPVIPNGLALCKLHHAAFDRHILGVRPDLRIEIRVDILEEEDGPMLEHGLQRFQGEAIVVPRAAQHRPEVSFLEERFEMFLRA
jgi:putative restriction endonuclease